MQTQPVPPMKSTMQKALGILAVSLAGSCFAGPQLASIDPNAGGDEQLTAARPPAEALDMRTLENRLKDTRAIDPISKLRLKMQIDELVGQFRRMHETGMSSRVGGLRRPYDNMIVKVQGMLDRDPALAEDIGNSREALWKVLSDPSKFRSQMTTTASAGQVPVNTLR